MKKDVLKIALVVLLCCGGLAQAVPITISITGNITDLAGTGRGSVPNTIYAGVGFTGTYTYDSSTPDSDANPQRGKYLHNSPYGISIALGGYEFKTSPNHTNGFEMQIRNDLNIGNGMYDSYSFSSTENISTLPAGFEIWYITWSIGDSTHTALSSDALPATVPVLTDWNHNTLEIIGVDSLGRTIDIVGTVATPEPLTGFLMMGGMLLLRRRR